MFFTRALVVRMHSLLVRGACCAKATHIFVHNASAARSCACSNIGSTRTHHFTCQNTTRNT